MRKIILLFLLTGILSNCTAQNTTKSKEKKISKEMIPTIDKNFEVFDSQKFNNSKKENPYVLREFLSDGNYLELDQGSYGKGYKLTPKNSFYQILKLYYKNGNIKIKGVGFNGNGFHVGTWYEFDESGNVIKETDYDKPYQFTFEEIVKFCENEKIPLQKGPILQSTGYHTVIRRNFNSEGSWWQIEWLKKPNTIEIITLDGNTGKVLKRQEAEYTNN
ncbi:hypothetical protein ABXT06_02665 [Flavobacterium sp. UW10123]|uniref:hypothetical protein n=1 Tax=Flavobacterium sp. UW10123 TaxID=3230800 RepID=UPI00339A33D9